MVSIPGGVFRMGSDRYYPEEGPVHAVAVGPFRMDRTPVTNRQFRDFVTATGYRTLAERAPDPTDYPRARAELMKPGSAVFSPPGYRVGTDDWSVWWQFRLGADWRHPYGPGSSLRGIFDHPVVHVAFEDALAYATWVGKDLPTEAEWEFAARGGLNGADYAWGDEFMPNGAIMANTWHGVFPNENTRADGFDRTSPVGAFPANGYGLHDMIGNTWEWTVDFYAPRHDAEPSKACCLPLNPRRSDSSRSYDPAEPDIRIPRRVIKGGSHLCAPNYCRRYRPAARHAQAVDTATTHVGFRCVVRPG